MKLTVVFLFTFMGTPCIFYGDEIGLTGTEIPTAANAWNGILRNEIKSSISFIKG